MTIPEPVLSDGDIVEDQSSSVQSSRPIWKTWSQEPIKAAVLYAILSKTSELINSSRDFRGFISMALGQNRVCFLHYSLLEVEDVQYSTHSRIPPKSGISSLF
jgi:hypothetical protein